MRWIPGSAMANAKVTVYIFQGEDWAQGKIVLWEIVTAQPESGQRRALFINDLR